MVLSLVADTLARAPEFYQPSQCRVLVLDRLKIGGTTPSPTPSLYNVKERRVSTHVPGLALNSVFLILLPQLLKQFESNDGGWCFLLRVFCRQYGVGQRRYFLAGRLLHSHSEVGACGGVA